MKPIEYAAVGIFVGVIVGVIVGGFNYGLTIFNSFRQRYLIKKALTSEINILIRQLKDYKEYFLLENHSWLKEGSVIEAPVIKPIEHKIFNSVLSQLYFFKTEDMDKILSFYHYVESCEKLISILFSRIQQQQRQNITIDKERVDIRKIQVNKIVNALDKLPKSSDFKNFPSEYQIETAAESAKKIEEFRKT
ncbi:MAG: hypothetical protein GY749_28685 [Desulfobacteraceae bacterium]|nr:hypothetical protein [Desulfobacteraceae bacterium]